MVFLYRKVVVFLLMKTDALSSILSLTVGLMGTVFRQNFVMVNRIWPTAVAGEAYSVSSVSASACHIGGPNSVNPGQILLVYGILGVSVLL